MQLQPMRRHPVVTFFLLTFLISWGGVLIVALPSGIPASSEDLERLYGRVFLPMLFAPVLSALIVSAVSGGRATLGVLFKGLAVWRAKPLDYAAVFLLIPSCLFAILLPLAAVSPAYTPNFLVSANALQTIIMFVGLGLAIGILEETGWTGFAISRLMKGRSVLRLGIGFGVIHGFWHFLVTYWQVGEAYGFTIIPFILSLWLLALVTMRILIVWVYSRTRSTLLAGAAHASHTGWLFAAWPSATTPQQDVIWTTAFAVLGLCAVFALVYLTASDPPRSFKDAHSSEDRQAT